MLNFEPSYLTVAYTYTYLHSLQNHLQSGTKHSIAVTLNVSECSRNHCCAIIAIPPSLSVQSSANYSVSMFQKYPYNLHGGGEPTVNLKDGLVGNKYHNSYRSCVVTK